ncbi:MAG: helicase-exonuclease AddAB subunit AddB [Suilimivivens sp.]
MSLQFYFGPSGSGKSKKLHTDMVEWAAREPERNFLFLVPDQFTMQTQFDLVNASENKGIMNIDVLSFGRLAHRIFEETGFGTKPVLDDTGKSLVLRKVAANLQDELPLIGKNLHKIGYIHEVKSALSEFMQYGIAPDQVSELADYAKERGTLYYKLRDLQILYAGFLSYIKNKFVTTEETLELLTRAVEKSDIIKDSVVVFDGFTGFTPIQNRLIQRLMELTKRVIVSITIDIHGDPFEMAGDQELFHLSKKTVKDLCRLAKESGVERTEDIRLREEPLFRFRGNPELSHLEKHLFRYPLKPYKGTVDNISIMEAVSPASEARQVCIKIKELVLSGEYSYREIAVVAGNLETYADYLEREGKTYKIPMFMDRTRGLLLNPFIEFIRSSLKICLTDFSYEAVFHYLRSGLADFTNEEIDRLENYVLALGIKGKRKWSRAFTRNPRVADEEEQLLLLEQLNQTREKLMEQLSPLLQKKKTAGEYVRTLYDFIVGARIQEKLSGYENYFKSLGDMEKAKEYAQVYRLVMELFEQIEGLLAEEELTMQEFADILDAGFSEIEIGIIPGSVDRIVVGDMERTRLKQVRVLFFLGVNDGNIPKNNSKGGIISDIDREFLQESEFELAPTPRQQMYIQRLYLYMNMTKPSEQLHLSYARVSSEGKSIRPSYLIDMIKRLYPEIEVTRPDSSFSPVKQIVGPRDGLTILSQELRHYREGNQKSGGVQETATLLKVYEDKVEYRELADKMAEAAFMQYQHSPLSQVVARAIYGSMLENSVSRLEQYAACAYSHFLQYGLMLKEREEYSFEQVDLGNIYHEVLEGFAGKLSDNAYTWFDFPEEEGDRLLKEALESSVAAYGETILYSNARYEYMIDRIYRILKRTIRTMKSQLRGSAFVPAHFEMSFSRVENLETVNIALTEKEKMKLRGRIDRIDTCEDEDHVYVKIIDYKSGNKKFDLAALYYGLQLQLVVYMNVATEIEKKKHPDKEIVPAALLYYHVDDPMIKEEKEMTPEEINDKLLKELRTTGIVNDQEKVISLLDREFSDKSLLIPVERKKDGSFSASSSVISKEDYETVSSFVNQKIKQFGREILSGNIELNPCETGTGTACTYCAYKGVCGFDEKIPGFETRNLPKLSEDEAMEKMRKEEQAWQ